MTLPPVVGHGDLRRRLAESARSGRLPPSLLFHGPGGVGKQRLALWLARLLQCERLEACGRCRACRLALRLEHPDVHWFFPLPRPSGSRDRLREKLEDARMEAIEGIRENPLRPRREEGATGIYLAAVQEIRSRASRRPAMGPRSVFIVGDAEKMVPQAANPEAANAFLKVLEEPPEDTFIFLTSSRPGALLPTVRSRVLSLRVPPLAEEEVAGFLEEHVGLDGEGARRVARVAQGSIGRALRLTTDREQAIRDEATDLLRLAIGGSRARRLRHAVQVSPAGARGEFSEVLAAVQELIRDLLAAVTDDPGRAFAPSRIRNILDGRRPHPHSLIRAAESVEEARRLADANVNPQAITSVLLDGLADTLRETPPEPT